MWFMMGGVLIVISDLECSDLERNGLSAQTSRLSNISAGSRLVSSVLSGIRATALKS